MSRDSQPAPVSPVSTGVSQDHHHHHHHHHESQPALSSRLTRDGLLETLDLVPAVLPLVAASVVLRSGEDQRRQEAQQDKLQIETGNVSVIL